MSANSLTRVEHELASTLSYRIGSHRITSVQAEDFATISNALLLWSGILLDHSLMLGDSPRVRSARDGRIIKMLVFSGEEDLDLTPILTYIDDCDSVLIECCTGRDPFKQGILLRRIKAAPFGCDGLVDLLSGTINMVRKEMLGTVEAVKLCHQTLSFLKKLEVDRPDLREEAYLDFFRFESELAERSPLRSNPECAALLDEMNALARTHLKGFCVESIVPKHGPGAVSDSSVKDWYTKYRSMNTDARIGYLLTKSGLGIQQDYNPFVSADKSSRTSRFVAVPKTWKKLRGISAEPVELQFYQQAVLAAIDTLFHLPWWNQRVRLHDQTRSRELALQGSLTSEFGTIDLSAASDSVTLELVKEVFKGTSLLPWLLGTRSVFTDCNGSTIRLKKFAPMGSATCFPVECIIFTLAAQVASDRSRTVLESYRETVCVFGDDIIVDWYACDECILALELLGFTVNTGKSFTSGCFREACGVEAYLGNQVQPLRYKSINASLGSCHTSPECISTSISYSNALYERGYIQTRRLLVERLVNSKLKFGNKSYSVGDYIPVTFDGTRGSLASSQPTCFRNKLRFSKELYAFEMRMIVFRRKQKKVYLDPAIAEAVSTLLYVEWLTAHQSSEKQLSSCDGDVLPFASFDAFEVRLPIGTTMVPRLKWGPFLHTDTLGV